MVAIPYYKITPCCPELGTQLSNFRIPGGTLASGSYQYIGANTSINGIIFKTGFCYTIRNEGTSSGALPNAPSAVYFSLNEGCLDEKCNPCITYYTLNDCCTDQPINWPPNEEGLQGTLYLAFDGTCNEGDFNNTPCPNDLTNLIITEIINDLPLNITGCLKVTEVPETDIPEGADVGNWESIMLEVSTVQTCADCQECCYTLTNCETDEVIYSTTNTLIQHFGNTVTLNGYDGCWQVTLTEGVCDCPVPVTVLKSFDGCPSCLPIVAYKFTNCNNQISVQYSTEDYSAYVGKTVELECGGCWFVSQIDYTPPSTQIITILFTFDSCLTCNRTYYKLVDCLDPNVNIVYTYTDLSQYLGQTIKIKGCDSCFTVLEETREPVNPGVVEVTDSYLDCPECLVTFPCICSTIANTSDVEQTYCYIDCAFEQQSITLQPQETSDKVCVIKWIVCPQTCDCVTGSLTANGETTTYEFLPTGETHNGKPVYQDCFNSNPGCFPPIPIDACYTIQYENDNCWYASVTNNCETNIHQVFKKCSESACSTDPWEYIPCTRLGVFINSELPFQAVLSVNDYTADVFSYGNPTTGLYIAFNTAINQWEMSFDGEVFETLEEGLSPCDGTDDDRVIWGNNFFAPQTWDIDAPGPYEFTSENCGGIVPVSDLNTGYIQFYGDCVESTIGAASVFLCPTTTYPKRKVKPGYSTPSCDIEKYEKITCKASEIYYKQVMRLRYGISNCCPEEEEKWLIKKELIDLVALIDPDYICTPVTSCCGQTLNSCGCGCNQTLKTCNSQ
jgi:hypothetical protein